jgi:hypothetical protein
MRPDNSRLLRCLYDALWLAVLLPIFAILMGRV